MSNTGWTTHVAFYTISMMEHESASTRLSPARAEIARLTGEFGETVRDPLWKDIPLSAGFKKLFRSRPMQKLDRIKQLGPAHLLYPGAVHTRMGHSIGVFHITRLIILSLLSDWIVSNRTLPLTREGIQAVLAAAMLHDVGHFPFAHSLKELITREHESLGADIIGTDRELCSIISEDLHTSVDAVRSIINTSLPCDDSEIVFYRKLLSGTLDPDKLDYLSRDAFFCGIPYGMQDASYIIRRLTYTETGTLAVPIEAIGSVEHLLFSKYLMYQNVYWHHTTRSATAMIKRAVGTALALGMVKESDLYDLDDESFFALLSRIPDSTPAILLNKVRDNRLLTVGAQLPFIPGDTRHEKLSDPGGRKGIERAIHLDLSAAYPGLPDYQVIVDVPEDISFESDIPILLRDGTTNSFTRQDELFTPSVVRTFTDSLRKIRLYVPEGIDKPRATAVLLSAMDIDHV